MTNRTKLKKTEVGSEHWNLGFYLILAEERD